MVWFATTHALFILETSAVLITPVKILVLVVSRNDSRARDSRDESRADDDSRNEPSAFVDSRSGLRVQGDFQRDDETFLGVRKDGCNLSRCSNKWCQTDGVTLPVLGSSSSFS